MPSEIIELETGGTEPTPLKTILHLVQAPVLLKTKAPMSRPAPETMTRCDIRDE
jgi:hypothetical protein